MAKSDYRYRHGRASSWTRRDQQREDAARRLQERAQLKEQKARVAMLAGMDTVERENFLQQEQAEQEATALVVKQEQEAREAAELERKESMKDGSRLAAGYLVSEFATAVKRRERYLLQEGDWLEDPAETYLTGKGFAEEYQVATGIRLQVNLCLDCSNSMSSNNLETVTKETLWAMYLMLRQVERALPPGTLGTQVWLWALGEEGRSVRHPTRERRVEDTPPTPEEVDTLVMESIATTWMSGEDTYVEPLLDRIEQWELEYGDTGAFRLDIILTDGVLEHPKDIRLANQVQDRRNGDLQTVILNFLPRDEWGDYPVPNRCVQYPADPTNVMALMRMAIGDWVNTL